ncbi:D-alanyl-D-alanine carboxypeptidase/D-alanyl-D-alanine-endopeptidase [Heyndrickxia acidicola]|uniref:D-alanyl-D-alanine carboxypeptidase/D-alanyl-D-alanine-endopeptidase n=1 Tax=Heyndrickxia acidicola TaxID=209389 RepID=A0ABU6MHB3_9BACI|nr:D-alanyl-D-alanine carboxypeptidase/D-alanyl-D-alanine-endopeptidase [Heyndrickxia acidicola]MED1204072.1 D-alanyl-D-alanine carboxypeptidase/D-alanyl-D-alanine-endopeptidase [Heyndrickxia acidicola]
MKNVKRILVNSFLGVFLAVAMPLQTAGAVRMDGTESDALKTSIQPILGDKRLQGSIAGISIRDAISGGLLYSYNGSVRLRPASNLKLLTAASALHVLGSGYTFQTKVLTDGKINGSVLKGNVYLQGNGDPTLLAKDVNRLAKKLKLRHISKIEGNIYGDDSRYDSLRYSIDLPWSDEDDYYGAGVSALTVSTGQEFDNGTAIIQVKPGKKAGDPAAIRVIPDSKYLTIKQDVQTVKADGRRFVTTIREHGNNQVTVKGTIPLQSSVLRKSVAVWEPSLYALTLFKQSLKASGIKFEKHSEKMKRTPKKAVILAVHQSKPLGKMILPLLKYSNNGHAEIFTKELGKVVYNEGTWNSGTMAIGDIMSTFGVRQDHLYLRDGSGISQSDLVPPNDITKLLFAIQSYDWFPVFLNALPVSGSKSKELGGTLRNRLMQKEAAGRIRAKTGSLTGVSSLSGYAVSISGKRFIFSVMINNFIVPDIKSIEDKIALSLLNL